MAVDCFRSQSYPPYAGGPLPPQYREGGYPFRDMGVHALYLLEAFLGEIEDVAAQFTTRDGDDANLLYNEWRALVRSAKGTGQFHLSWSVNPFQNLLLVQGTRGQIRADLFGMSVTLKRTRRLPEFVQRPVNACGEAAKALVQVPANVLRVLLGSVRRYHGLQAVVEQFYRNLRADRPAPVTPEQARSVVYWTERVARQADRAKDAHLERFPKNLTAPILVTGANGFIAKHLLRRLLVEHDRLRILVRRPTAEMMRDSRLEIVAGDLGDPAAVERAVAGTELVYHLGAACRGTAADFRRGTVVGTQNIVDSVVRHDARLVYISSLSVLHAAAMRKGARVAEGWPLEPNPDACGLYTQTKLDAERVVCQAVKERNLRAVILRPGLVCGPGGPLLTPAVGRRRGNRRTVLGNGNGILPLVYVEDLVDAILQAGRHGGFDGAIYQVVNDVVMTQNDLVREVATHEPLRVCRLPRWLVYTLAFGVQTLAKVLRRAAPLSIYRVRSSIMRGVFDCGAARTALGWRPRIGVRAGLLKTFAAQVGPPETPPAPSANGVARHALGAVSSE